MTPPPNALAAFLADHGACDAVEVWDGDDWLFSVGETSGLVAGSKRAAAALEEIKAIDQSGGPAEAPRARKP
ncbi:MAG: hypothetical protein ACYC8V_02140 [Caulobacteraceae bacterium]